MRGQARAAQETFPISSQLACQKALSKRQITGPDLNASQTQPYVERHTTHLTVLQGTTRHLAWQLEITGRY